MKKFVLIFLCLMLALSASAFADAAGDPWVLTHVKFNSYITREYTYNEAGQVILAKDTNTKQDYTGISNYTYTPNTDGTTTVRWLNDTEAYDGNEIILDANGWCIEQRYYSSFNADPEDMFAEKLLETVTKYEYDEAGRLILSTRTTVDNGKTQTVSYTYDEQGRLTDRTSLNNAGAVYDSRTFTFDANGNPSTGTASMGGEANHYTFTREDTLDDEGRITSITISDGSPGSFLTVSYEYSETGALCRVIFDNFTCVAPGEYFPGQGHLLEENATCNRLTFMPLSVALENQSGN